MDAILDCGTTNTKCYIVNEKGTLLSEAYSKYGVKDNSLSTNREKYKALLKSVVDEALSKIHQSILDLNKVIGFGMISSDLGLVVVPHATVPVDIETMRNGIYRVEDTSIFGETVPFYLIRGIKNALKKARDLKNLELCDFMRGEETQVVGIIEKYHPVEHFNVITFGSHVKIVHVNRDKQIVQSMTTMSGQVFDCIAHKTVVTKSVAIGEDLSMNMQLDDIIQLAEGTVASRGLMRALLLPRFMESFTDMTAMERLTYLDAVISVEDIKAIKEFYGDGPYSSRQYFFIGNKTWCEIFGKVLMNVHPNIEIIYLNEKEDTKEISILGARKITDKI